jgi:hypothetical protein
MGELRAVFDAMKKEREERRKSLEPSRVQYATDLLIEAWYAVAWDEREKAIYIYKSNDRKNHIAKLYPYKGWWTGKGIGSGRGVHELIKKLGENNVRNTNRRSESRSEKLSKQS